MYSESLSLDLPQKIQEANYQHQKTIQANQVIGIQKGVVQKQVIENTNHNFYLSYQNKQFTNNGFQQNYQNYNNIPI